MKLPLVGAVFAQTAALETLLASEFAGLRFVPADLGPATRLVLLDLDTRGGAAGISALLTAAPSAAVVAVSTDSARASVMNAIRAGAAGFIEKSDDPGALAKALRVVLDGGVWLPPAVNERRAPDRPGYGTWVPAARLPAEAGFSPAEAQVLKAMVENKSPAAIALASGQSDVEVEACQRAIFRRLDATARLPLVLAVARLGLRLGIGH